MEKIRIIIADDHPLFLKGLKDTLEEEIEFNVLDTAVNGQQAIDKITHLLPDIAILDLDMPLLNGIEVAKLVLKNHVHVKIIILSMHKDVDIIRAAMALGIHGYVFKDDAVNDLVKAIRTVVKGNQYISSDASVNPNPADQSVLTALTRMERLILKEIARQKTTKQIADENFVSIKTVENHRANICKKLNLYGNNSLLKFALTMVEYLE